MPRAWWVAGSGLLISALGWSNSGATSYLMETHPSVCSRTVPAALDTLSGLLWDLLWNLLPRWILSADPRGTAGTWGISPGAGMDQSRANNLQRAFPCPPHSRSTLQVSPSSPAIPLSRGSRGRGWGRGPSAWSPGSCSWAVPEGHSRGIRQCQITAQHTVVSSQAHRAHSSHILNTPIPLWEHPRSPGSALHLQGTCPVFPGVLPHPSYAPHSRVESTLPSAPSFVLTPEPDSSHQNTPHPLNPLSFPSAHQESDVCHQPAKGSSRTGEPS